MKKLLPWIQWTAAAVLLILWGVIGLRIADGKYDFMTEMYIAIGCWGVFFICVLVRIFTNRCPHCGKLRISRGRFCPYCGNPLES